MNDSFFVREMERESDTGEKKRGVASVEGSERDLCVEIERGAEWRQSS